MNNFVKRTISGIGFAAVMLAAFLTNEYVIGVVMLLSLVIMMKEFLSMTCGNEYRYSQVLSILSGAILFTLIYVYKAFDFPGRLVILAFVPVFILMINSLYLKDKSRFDKFANLYAALIYIAVPWSVLNFAAFAQEGGAFDGKLLLCFFGIIWGSDVGAYIFGITLGQKYGKKLFPSISPKKSWEGAIGGALLTVASALVVNHFFAFMNVWQWMGMALVVVIFGTFGDLTESMMKRHLDIKDSGHLLPGHGGILDRLDSMLFAIPAVVVYLLAISL
jgi:phosphatidate cytidylyltransferase